MIAGASRQKRISATSVALVLLGLAGYPIVASFTGLVGVGGTGASIAIRTGVVILSALLLARAAMWPKRGAISTALIIAVIFWSIYFIRVFNDTLIDNPGLTNDPYYYWMWAVGACFLPMLALSVTALSNRDYIIAFRLTLILFAAAAIMTAIGGSGTVVSAQYGAVQTGRLRIDGLNPISLGHIGVTLLLLTTWGALFVFKKNFISYIVVAALAAVGFYLLIGANSRGPLVAILVCSLIMITLLSWKYRALLIAAVTLAVGVFTPLALLLQDRFGLTIYSRMVTGDQLYDVSTRDRLYLYEAALYKFYDSPLLGSRMEQIEYGSYPHNIIIESFMATGVFGGTALIVFSSIALHQSVRLIRNDRSRGWVGILFVQYLVSAMFSGSLYSNDTFWVSAGLVIATMMPALRDRRFSPSPRHHRPLTLQPLTRRFRRHPSAAALGQSQH